MPLIALRKEVCCLASLLALTMAARAQESPWLYGIHDFDPRPTEYLNHFTAKGVTGWVTATVAVGHNPSDTSGTDFRAVSNLGHTVICRINNGYCGSNPEGTIPLPADYADFATRCANYVAASQGCTLWVIGNETNLASEWPASGGHKAYVSPQDYANCFRQVYNAIKAVRPSHKVICQALAPWAGPYGTGSACGATHDPMPLNWVQYMNEMLVAIAAGGPGPDGIALHIPSRGYHYADIYSTQKVNAGGQDLYWSFFCYKDWIEYGIPHSMWNLPLYATECNGNYYWKGGHPEDPAQHYEPGWMQEIYKEINRYNTVDAPAAGKPVFRCVNVYRWCADCDPWNIDGTSNPYKTQILSDLDAAIAPKYRWAPSANFTASPTSGNAQLEVTFTDTSTGSYTSRLWNFGDGATSSVASPTHTYLNPGSYTVSLTVSGPNGSDTRTRTNYIAATDPPGCIAYAITSFDEFTIDSPAMFCPPRAANTAEHLADSPDVAAVTRATAYDGALSCQVRWAFKDAGPGRWLRLTTSGLACPSHPVQNPTIDLRRPVRFRIRLESPGVFSLKVCIGVRETGVDVPVGQDGGTTGSIEWVGATAVESGAPQGMTINAHPGYWQTLTFYPYVHLVRAFTGDGILSAPNNKGVLEHIALTANGYTGPFTIYLDNFTQPCWPRGDFDHDGDVDQSDFGHLQRCLTGALVLEDPSCADSTLNGDDYVDDRDMSNFLECLTGLGLTPPELCLP